MGIIRAPSGSMKVQITKMENKISDFTSDLNKKSFHLDQRGLPLGGNFDHP